MHGYRVSSACTGEAALMALVARRFDVVVMDIKMPGCDGVTVLQEMDGPPPRVILMTAYAKEDRLRAAVDAHAFAVMHKPFETLRMLHLVADAAEEAK
jgi:two-component system, NtrC family, response regulator AtoC